MSSRTAVEPSERGGAPSAPRPIRGHRSLRLGTACLACVLGGVLGTSAVAQEVRGETVTTLQDSRITESSGLAVVGGDLVTVNDSGDRPRVYVVDPTSGATVGTTEWDGDAVDIEAVAPGRDATVWVGDIGDNRARRASLRITRVPVGRGDRSVGGETWTVTYPDGARDAESLAVHPTSGRAIVVSKELFGGVAYSFDPPSGGGTATLTRVADGLPRMATDAAFFPDGRHLVVRTYGSATVYAYPAWTEVGTFGLPQQRQGEGIAVDDDNRLLLSTEGAGTAVTRVTLPPAIRTAIVPAATPPPRATTAADSPGPGTENDPRPAVASDDDGMSPSLIIAGVAVIVVGALTALRIRARRRRR